jgi:hypothetical protein
MMAKAIEQKIKHCKTCQRKTKHMRETTRTGLLMFLVHLVLTVITAGLWLALVVVWLLLNTKIGGWLCEQCGK